MTVIVADRYGDKKVVSLWCVYNFTPQVEKNINNMTVKMPHQLFINGEFVDAEGGKTYKTINPTDGTVRSGKTMKERH